MTLREAMAEGAKIIKHHSWKKGTYIELRRGKDRNVLPWGTMYRNGKKAEEVALWKFLEKTQWEIVK